KGRCDTLHRSGLFTHNAIVRTVVYSVVASVDFIVCPQDDWQHYCYDAEQKHAEQTTGNQVFH
ncbi:TPA: hypothetical protein ACSU1D_004946, partial [Escherichia coli]